MIRLIFLLIAVYLPILSHADLSTGYYFIEGTIRNSKNEPIRNERVYLISKGLFRSFKTDANGGYRVRLEIFYNCLSGSGIKRPSKQDIEATRAYTGDTIALFWRNETALIKSPWEKFYNRGYEIDPQNTTQADVKLENRCSKNIHTFFEGVGKIEGYRMRIALLCDLLQSRKSALSDDKIAFTSVQRAHLLKEIGHQIGSLEGLLDFHNEALSNLQNLLSLSNGIYKIEKKSKQRYAIYFPSDCTPDGRRSLLNVAVDANQIIRSVTYEYCETN